MQTLEITVEGTYALLMNNAKSRVGHLGRARFVSAIKQAQGDAVEAIIRVGQLLIEAKAELPHGEFGKMVKEDLEFGPRWGQMLMAVASDARINAKDTSLLPPHPDTLYGLTRLSDDEWEVVEPHLTPDFERADIKRLAPPPAKPRLEVVRDTCSVPDLHELVGRGGRFGTVYADPPWPYDNQATRASTDNHYDVLSLDDIAALPVRALTATDAHLHLWTTNAFVGAAIELMSAWGFTYKSVFVWVKPQMGMGNYWRVSHELLLLGVKGSLPFADHAQMSWQEWRRGRHSAKPEQMAGIIETVSPGPYLELFARRQRRGWTSWGNEIERDLFYEGVA